MRCQLPKASIFRNIRDLRYVVKDSLFRHLSAGQPVEEWLEQARRTGTDPRHVDHAVRRARERGLV